MKKLVLLLIIILISSINPIFAEENDQAVSQEYVISVITKMVNGDKEVLKEIHYHELKAVFDYARVVRYPFDERRGKVVNSALNGLFNKDPRVSLLCIEILRKMGPDRLMEPEAELLYQRVAPLETNKLTKYTDYYEYHDITYGKQIKKSHGEEATKLYKFVLRDKILHRLLNVAGDEELLSKINKEHFLLLVEPIDNEKDLYIPFRSFGKLSFFPPYKLNVIYQGLNNTNITIQRECAIYLVNYYNRYAYRLKTEKRNEILKQIKIAYDNDIIARPKLVKFRTYNE